MRKKLLRGVLLGLFAWRQWAVYIIDRWKLFKSEICFDRKMTIIGLHTITSHVHGILRLPYIIVSALLLVTVFWSDWALRRTSFRLSQFPCAHTTLACWEKRCGGTLWTGPLAFYEASFIRHCLGDHTAELALSSAWRRCLCCFLKRLSGPRRTSFRLSHDSHAPILWLFGQSGKEMRHGVDRAPVDIWWG